jgi:hypothetical protein
MQGHAVVLYNCSNLLATVFLSMFSPFPAAELAEQCYEAARGAEPTLVAVWEAMAATAAARGSSSAGTAAAAAAAEHAVGLGGGPESWLEYATGVTCAKN